LLALRGMREEEILDDAFRENAEVVFGALWEVMQPRAGGN